MSVYFRVSVDPWMCLYVFLYYLYYNFIICSILCIITAWINFFYSYYHIIEWYGSVCGIFNFILRWYLVNPLLLCLQYYIIYWLSSSKVLERIHYTMIKAVFYISIVWNCLGLIYNSIMIVYIFVLLFHE